MGLYTAVSIIVCLFVSVNLVIYGYNYLVRRARSGGAINPILKYFLRTNVGLGFKEGFTADNNLLTLIGDSWAKPERSNILDTGNFRFAKDFIVKFDIRPLSNKDGWSNIFHNSLTNRNCCDMGDRQPAVWFFPNTTKLHVRCGATGNPGLYGRTGNNGLDPSYHLPIGKVSHVEIEFIGEYLRVVIKDEAGIVKYDNNNKMGSGRPSDDVYNNANQKFYFSDPWYPAAEVEVKNLTYDNNTTNNKCLDQGGKLSSQECRLYANHKGLDVTDKGQFDDSGAASYGLWDGCQIAWYNDGKGKVWHSGPQSYDGTTGHRGNETWKPVCKNDFNLEKVMELPESSNYKLAASNVKCKDWNEGWCGSASKPVEGVKTPAQCAKACDEMEGCKAFYMHPHGNCWTTNGNCEQVPSDQYYYIRKPGKVEESNSVEDSRNQSQYECVDIAGDIKSTFQIYNDSSLTQSQREVMKTTYPGKPASEYACLQGCGEGGTCRKLNKPSLFGQKVDEAENSTLIDHTKANEVVSQEVAKITQDFDTNPLLAGDSRRVDLNVSRFDGNIAPEINVKDGTKIAGQRHWSDEEKRRQQERIREMMEKRFLPEINVKDGTKIAGQRHWSDEEKRRQQERIREMMEKRFLLLKQANNEVKVVQGQTGNTQLTGDNRQAAGSGVSQPADLTQKTEKIEINLAEVLKKVEYRMKQNIPSFRPEIISEIILKQFGRHPSISVTNINYLPIEDSQHMVVGREYILLQLKETKDINISSNEQKDIGKILVKIFIKNISEEAGNIPKSSGLEEVSYALLDERINDIKGVQNDVNAKTKGLAQKACNAFSNTSPLMPTNKQTNNMFGNSMGNIKQSNPFKSGNYGNYQPYNSVMDVFG